MGCYYCDKIKAVAPDYVSEPASHDLGSEAPRCPKHWRYVCGMCGTANHFMQTAYCQETRKLFCNECALETQEVSNSFWAWKYHFNYRSPWSNDWASSLDRTEFEGTHPLQHDGTRSETQAAISQEQYLVRYPEVQRFWRPQREITDADVQSNWNTNAVKWNSLYDDDGDRNRRYQSDEPMLALLGDVNSKQVLDVGSGNGYLCRKLAKSV